MPQLPCLAGGFVIGVLMYSGRYCCPPPAEIPESAFTPSTAGDRRVCSYTGHTKANALHGIEMTRIC